MKQAHAFAGAMALTIFGAMVALSAPAQAQAYDPKYPVCLQVYDDFTHYYFECSYTSMPQCQASASGLRPMRGQSLLRRAKGQGRSAQKAPNIVSPNLAARAVGHDDSAIAEFRARE